jgi:hypothetical protein
MTKRRLIVDVEEELIALDMATSLLAKEPDDLIEYHYSGTREAIEKARAPLIALGMYDRAKEAVDIADAFRQRAEYKAASKVLYATFRELMRRSGTDARYEKKYRGLSTEEAMLVPKITPEDMLDEVRPDSYSGKFMEATSEHEHQLVFAVEDALYVLRYSILLSQENDADSLGPAFAAARDKVEAAKLPLTGLGVYRTLLEALADVESQLLHEKWTHEADEDLIMAAELVADRSGLTALRQQEFAAKRKRNPG